MTQQPVRPPHSLSRLQVGESRHQDINLSLCSICSCSDEFTKGYADQLQLTIQPQAGVGSNLVIPAASSVQLATNRANNFTQATLISSVDVFISRLDLKAASCPFSTNYRKTFNNGVGLVMSQDTGLGKGPCISLATLQQIKKI